MTSDFVQDLIAVTTQEMNTPLTTSHSSSSAASGRPNYGIDAPSTLEKWGMLGLVLLVICIFATAYLPPDWWAYLILIPLYSVTFGLLYPCLAILLGSFIFKFYDREWLFREMGPLRGDERVLDVGCGHGLLLIGAAKRIRNGMAVGLDLWSQDDQAENSKNATLRNAELENVSAKVEIVDGDMRSMPFEDSSFDVVVSSWAIHNLYVQSEREKALSECVRVLKVMHSNVFLFFFCQQTTNLKNYGCSIVEQNGGTLAILDIDHGLEYHKYLTAQQQGWRLAEVKVLGPHLTFGNFTHLVIAKKALL